MTDPQTTANALPPVHPGAILRDTVMPALGLGIGGLAETLGVAHSEVGRVIQGYPVSADMALRLGKLCGNGPDLWINLQSAYDLRLARERIGEALDAIPTMQVA